MQQRNLLIFFLVALLLVMGTYQLRQRFWPPPIKEKNEEIVVKGKTEKKKEERKVEAGPSQLPPQPAVTPNAKLISLGSSDSQSPFHLFADLDPLGGGVRRIIANKFKEAAPSGRGPLDEPLELVPGDVNRYVPSFLMYHFAPGDAKADHPLDSLGRSVWKIVKNKDGKDVTVDSVDGKERQSVSFRSEVQGVTITKTFSLTEGDYHLALRVDLERPKAAADAKPADLREIKFRYQLTGAKGLPVEGKWYTSVYRNAMLALEDDRGYVYRDLQDLRQISLWGGGNVVEQSNDRFLRYAGVAVQYFASVVAVDNDQKDQRFVRKARATLETAVARGKIKGADLIAPEKLVIQSEDGKTTDTVFIPPDLRDQLKEVKEGTTVAVVYRLLNYNEKLKDSYKVAVKVGVGEEALAIHPLWEDDITVRVTTEPVDLGPGSKVTHRYLLYNGPVKPSLLGQLTGDRAVDDSVISRYVDGLKLNTLTDYHSPGVMGEFASRIFWTDIVIKCTNVMHLVLGLLHRVVPSFGLCIILLTVMVRGMMFPLSRKQALMSMRMQELAPELKKLQEKHKDDKQALAGAQWELYRKHGVSPFGSCWVVFLQMPIFMGLYYALQESIQFRLADFWPTWIKNLAAPDMMVYWGEAIPMLSRPQDFGGFLYLGPYLNLLPILAVSLMIAQQKMLMPPPADEQQEMQQKMMKWMMVFFGLMFYKVAAGLCIYFIASSVWGFAERKLLPKIKHPKVGADVDMAGVSTSGSDQIATASRSGSSSAISGANLVQAKKQGRNKRRAERDRASAAATKAEEARTGLGRLRQRLTNWWNDVLDQAKKK